ncbi:Protein of unknown function [Gryllus bimaculatus]|nr:Protein of unknown function [Gryllus bimaculatus]
MLRRYQEGASYTSSTTTEAEQATSRAASACSTTLVTMSASSSRKALFAALSSLPNCQKVCFWMVDNPGIYSCIVMSFERLEIQRLERFTALDDM